MKVYFIKTPDTRELYPAVGFSYVMAAMIKAGFDVEFIDANLIEYPHDVFMENPRKCLSIKPDWLRIEQYLKPYKIEFAFLTGSFTKHITNTARLSGILKKLNPRCNTIVGGVHVSALPEDTLKRFDTIDFVVIGEGEKVAVDLARALKNNADVTKIPSLGYRNNGTIAINQNSYPIEDINTLANPAKSLWPIQEYRKVWKYLWDNKDPLGLVMTSRGCIGKCHFCASGKKDIDKNILRMRSFENVKQELEELFSKYAIQSIDFIDDCFTLNKHRLALLCEYLKGKKVSWICKSRVDTVSKDMLKMMKDSRCKSIFLGIESLNDKILESMGKGINFKTTEKCLELFDSVELGYAASFTIGHPGETKGSMKQTIHFAKKLARKGIGVGLYLVTPYPGTHLYDISKANGWIKSEDWDSFDQLADKDSVYAYDGWTPETLTKFYRAAWKELDVSRVIGKILNLKFINKELLRLNSVRDIKILLKRFLSAVKRQFTAQF